MDRKGENKLMIESFTYQVSGVLCHMSHVTCHVSCVMCHMSNATCQLSLVTNAQQPQILPPLTPPLCTLGWFARSPQPKFSSKENKALKQTKKTWTFLQVCQHKWYTLGPEVSSQPESGLSAMAQTHNSWTLPQWAISVKSEKPKLW